MLIDADADAYDLTLESVASLEGTHIPWTFIFKFVQLWLEHGTWTGIESEFFGPTNPDFDMPKSPNPTPCVDTVCQ